MTREPTLLITVPIERLDVNEQAMVIVEAEINNPEYYIAHIEDEAGNEITSLYSNEEFEYLHDEIFEMVNQERNEYLIGTAESRYETQNGRMFIPSPM